jgi:hypothetical protein
VKRDRNLNPVRIKRRSRHPRDLILHQSGRDPQHDFTPGLTRKADARRSPNPPSSAPAPETQQPRPLAPRLTPQR